VKKVGLSELFGRCPQQGKKDVRTRRRAQFMGKRGFA